MKKCRSHFAIEENFNAFLGGMMRAQGEGEMKKKGHVAHSKRAKCRRLITKSPL